MDKNCKLPDTREPIGYSVTWRKENSTYDSKDITYGKISEEMKLGHVLTILKKGDWRNW